LAFFYSVSSPTTSTYVMSIFCHIKHFLDAMTPNDGFDVILTSL